jgi:hypothetical protein
MVEGKMPNNDSQLQLLEQIACSLQELIKLTRIMSYPAIRQVLQTALDTEQKRLVYHLLDGTKSVEEIQKLAKVKSSFIPKWGREWETLGIVVPDSRVKGRRLRCFDLPTFGIPILPVAMNADNNDEKADQDELA